MTYLLHSYIILRSKMNDITVINPELPTPPAEKRVWGGWATAGFGAVVLVVFTIVQVVVVIIGLIAIAFSRFELFSNQEYEDVFNSIMDMLTGHQGLLQSIATIISGVIGVGLIIIFIRVHKRAGIIEYLGLNKITVRGFLLVVAIYIGFMVLSGGLNILLGKTDNEQIMFDIYDTSVWPVLFWIAVVVFAPAFEEVFFRGFLFEGFRQSRLGAIGAIGITALIWALIHSFQYGLYSLAWILVLGIVMGIVRLKTKSLWSTIIMHVLVNVVATLEIALNLDRFIS